MKLLSEGRTHSHWLPKPVSDTLLQELYSLVKWGPTAANTCPARFVFIRTPEGKARLKPALDAGNVEKTLAAPVTAIVAYDLEFYEKMPKLFPHAKDARSWFAGNPAKIDFEARRSGTLQGGYFILAARSLGLDCGPMGGFDAEKVNAEFFAGTPWRSNFLCNLGYGDASKLFPRGPRLEFKEACQFV